MQDDLWRLSPEDAAAVDALLDRRGDPDAWKSALPPDQAARAERVSQLLALLELDPVEPAPDDLTERTLARIAAQNQRLRFAEQVDMLREAPTGLGFGWRQFLSAAAIFVIGLSLLMPVLERSRAEAQRIACAANLQQAGMGFTRYAADFGGVLPRRSVEPGEVWWNVGDTGNAHRHAAARADQSVNSNSAHLYLLFKSGYAAADALYCPTNTHTTPDVLSRERDDWAAPEAVSFSYQNQYTPRPIRLETRPGLALLSDRNPLFVVKVGRVTFDPTTSALAPSRSHGSAGQNVLLADGTVTWTIRPMVQRNGQDRRDNIWTIPNVTVYRGTEIPVIDEDQIDSFLVP